MSSRSAELFREAQKYLPGGVSRNTLLRPPYPFYVKSGSGCRVTDIDDVERIDFANNMAALIHGHAFPPIVDAVSKQLRLGTAFTLATEVEVEFARLLCNRSRSFEKVRFMNSGTEAVMAGLKAARAFTGRARFAKVEGTYHGSYDYAEVSQAPSPEAWGPAERPTSVPVAVGTPAGVLSDVIVIPFNDRKAAIATLNEHRDDIACVLLDPMPHRIGLVPSEPDFMQAIRDWTWENNALMFVDEVITFRTEVEGMQARYDVLPDVTALGKIIGGGFPVGALAGRDEVMSVFASAAGEVPKLPHSGTFSANPITMTAGSVAIEHFDRASVARLNRLGDLARSRIREAIEVADVPACVTGAGSLFRIHMRSQPPRDYRSGFPTREEKEALRRFVDGLYDEGIVIIHTGTGALSTAMTEVEIDRLADAVLASLRRIGTAPLSSST